MRFTKGAAAALILVGCSTDHEMPTADDTTDPNDGTSMPADYGQLYPSFLVVESDGTLPSTNGVEAFAARGDAYLNATATPPSVLPGDFYFEVAVGANVVSTDDPSCRRIHIDEEGNIDQIYVGDGGCQHSTQTDPTGQGKLLVQLAPFATASGGQDEAGTYCVNFVRLNLIEAGAPPPSVCFDVIDASHTPPQYPCGDGVLDDNEQCDDGNNTDGDGCSATCRYEDPHPYGCGNGELNDNETCDDGNTTSGDGCSATCQTENPPPPNGYGCGNGELNDNEQCDDGNTTDGDGCSATCQSEVPPPPPGGYCGDGHVDEGEACDDGNTVAGDGCNACAVEPPCDP